MWKAKNSKTFPIKLMKKGIQNTYNKGESESYWSIDNPAMRSDITSINFVKQGQTMIKSKNMQVKWQNNLTSRIEMVILWTIDSHSNTLLWSPLKPIKHILYPFIYFEWPQNPTKDPYTLVRWMVRNAYLKWCCQMGNIKIPRMIKNF